jgi:nicotinamide-nucleotide amidase
MKQLMPHAERAAALLKQRKETVAVMESSAGGLITAALLAVPGASAYMIGGTVAYTRDVMLALKNVSEETLKGARPATEANALMRANVIRKSYGAVWGLSETGAAGPTGNRYGDAAGHTCVAVAGPVERSLTVETQSDNRPENMYAFAAAALKLLADTLESHKS